MIRAKKHQISIISNDENKENKTIFSFNVFKLSNNKKRLGNLAIKKTLE
jgi:hypothetical protein